MADIEESLPIGQKFQSVGRTIGEGEFTLLHNLTWLTAPLHSDREYMKSTQFGERILAGPCLLALAWGIATRGELYRLIELSGLRPVAALGIDNARFKSPVFPGDTLTVETEIVEVRSTKKRDRWVIRFKDVTSRQTGEIVIELTRANLYERG